MKGIADILLGSVSKYLFSSRKMALATAFGQNSGPDRYPDLGRLSCGHTSLVGRFGRCVPKSASRLNFVSDNRSMGGRRRILGAAGLHARVLCGGSGYLAPGRSQNWIKSRPLAIMRQKSTRHAAGDGGGCSKCSDQNGQQAPGTAVLRFRWCRFRSQCCTGGYAQGRALGVDQSAAALWLSSNHSWPVVFPHSAILTSCRRR